MIEFDNCWDTPINTVLGPIETMIREENEKQIYHAIAKIGIDIDKEGLLKALNHDKERYEKAYREGWKACEEHYKEKLDRIRKESEVE